MEANGRKASKAWVDNFPKCCMKCMYIGYHQTSLIKIYHQANILIISWDQWNFDFFVSKLLILSTFFTRLAPLLWTAWLVEHLSNRVSSGELHWTEIELINICSYSLFLVERSGFHRWSMLAVDMQCNRVNANKPDRNLRLYLRGKLT